MARSYWLNLFSLQTWQEFLDHGADVSGFTEGRWPAVRRMKPGDYLLCYITGISRWVGVLEVVGEPFQDNEPIWGGQIYPSRVPVRRVVTVKPEHGVPVLNMRNELTVFRNLRNPNLWSGPFRGSPAPWKAEDGEAVLHAIHDAEANPVKRPIGKKRPGGKRKGPTDDDGPSIPEDDELEDTSAETASVHTEMQYLLLKLGADMGFEVHVARNDQSRTWKGQRLGDMPRRRPSLPQQFDPKTNETIELIDVLWLDRNEIVAAFEIESTTSIYSGLLRMSDLLSQQPNIKIPLFLLAPEEREEKVRVQVNRPTFGRMNPPLAEVCRYIPFEGFRDALNTARDYISYLKWDWLQTISEDLRLEAALT